MGINELVFAAMALGCLVAAGIGGFVAVRYGQPTATANRVPNTGSYSWVLPTTLNTHQVYLKFAAWDVAGNRSEVVTPRPVLVDLTRPRVKIQGIEGVGSRP